MIQRVGIDIVSTIRIDQAIQNPRFIERILTKSEREQEITPTYVAGRWAAKEAIKKCIPTLKSWHEVEIINRPDGAPEATVDHPNFNPSRHLIHISISHEDTHTVALAILETRS